MFEQDYLMRIIAQLLGAIRKTMERGSDDDDDATAKMLDMAIGEATELDADAILNLAPESMASILSMSGVDPHVVPFIARSLLLSSRYHRSAGNDHTGDLRYNQAYALANAYGVELCDEDISDEALEELALSAE